MRRDLPLRGLAMISQQEHLACRTTGQGGPGMKQWNEHTAPETVVRFSSWAGARFTRSVGRGAQVT